MNLKHLIYGFGAGCLFIVTSAKLLIAGINPDILAALKQLISVIISVGVPLLINWIERKLGIQKNKQLIDAMKKELQVYKDNIKLTDNPNIGR